jgi:16S rRNA processing protein RimM
VGQIRGLNGLRGMVRVEILTDDPSRFKRGSLLYPEGSDVPLTVSWARADARGMLVRFHDVTTREAAEAFRERYLEADVGEPLPEGSFYWHEVEGTTVTTIGGEALGTVAEVFRAGGGEVFIVRGGPRGEVLVPAVGSVVREFSPGEGRIVVDIESLGLDEAPVQRRPRGRRTTRALKAGTAVPSSADAPSIDPPTADAPSIDQSS